MDAVSAGYRNIDEDTQTVSEKIIVSGINFAAGRTAHRPVGHQRRRQVDLHQDHRRRAAIAGGRHSVQQGPVHRLLRPAPGRDAAPRRIAAVAHDQARAQCARAGCNFLGSFNFNGAMATSPITPFSGGEKARLALALIVWQRPNLLLLDEPTNHLDLETREADQRAGAVRGHAGAGLARPSPAARQHRPVHHRGRRSVRPFDGDLDDYKAWLYQTKLSAKAA